MSTWDKLDGWVEDIRREQEREKFDEWIQWLVAQLKRHEKESGMEPAYLRHLDWRP